jgi:predicted aminopeptidase
VSRRAARWGLAGAGLVVLVALGVASLGGCATAGYLANSARGHLEVMSARRPVKDVEADPATPEALRERLALTQRMRDFAVSDLHLPDNGSYRTYADLKRSAAVWNVVAAPELSLKLQTWCFPIVGCVGYRGYYSLDEAEAAAKPLREQGLDVGVYPVPAYSTLGWMNWAGGDPILNTFVGWPDSELSKLIFHELAHQVAYAAGDTTFNESFATAVERLGSERWMAGHSTATGREEQQRMEGRRNDFRFIVHKYREQLGALYASTASDDEKRAGKAAIYAAMRDEVATYKRERWGGWSGYDAWFARANNAEMGAQAAYDDQVPLFERLFHDEGDDFRRFYAEVVRMSKLDRPARDQAMARLGAEVREANRDAMPPPAASAPLASLTAR